MGEPTGTSSDDLSPRGEPTGTSSDDLSPRGEPADGEHDPIWYVAYGSNLLRSRFLTYLNGGAGPRGSGAHTGARDTTPPRADLAVCLDRHLIFTGRSQRWDGGGVCAVVPTGPSSAEGVSCLGRAWLISRGQLLDVWRQENGGRDPGSVPWSVLSDVGRHDVPEGRYRRLDWLDPIDRQPAVTITCGEEMLAEQNPPTVDYLTTVGRGLIEGWGLSSEAAVDYLWRAGGGKPVDVERRARLLAALSSGPGAAGLR